MNPSITRLEESYSPEPMSGCWLWTKATTSRGYGSLTVEGKTVVAHRWAYTLLRGPIPEGLQIDHLCRVKCCVNPWHMEPVSQRENILRGPGWALNGKKTRCPKGHEYEGENLYARPGRRFCRACRSATNRAIYVKKKLRFHVTDKAAKS